MIYHYRQTEAKIIDEESDFVLLSLIKSNLSNPLNFQTQKSAYSESQLKKINEHKNCAEIRFKLSAAEKIALADKKNESTFYKESKVAPFKVVRLANMLNRVIQEEASLGIMPTVGEFHQWKKTDLPYTMFSKTLWALARGETSRYMITGKEKILKNWILEQADESITLEKMFRQSYQINQGNVYLTLLTIENVLSENWQNPERAQFLTTKKLKLFTNTVGNDDRFGHWYHLFGVILYGYVKNGVNASFVGNMESLSSLLMKRQHEHQENRINTQGGKVGARLYRWLKKDRWQERKTEERFLDEDYYLQ